MLTDSESIFQCHCLINQMCHFIVSVERNSNISDFDNPVVMVSVYDIPWYFMSGHIFI